LVLDARGERDSCAIAVGEGNTIRFLDMIPFPHSLGMIFMQLTEHLGFRGGEDEYKVMGLASYGEPEYIKQFRDLIKTTANGKYEINLSYLKSPLVGPTLLSQKFYDIFGKPRKKGDKIEQRYTNIAASLQARLEEVVLHMLEYYRKKTDIRKLCMVGGIALNSVLNGKILASGLFDEIFIPPAAGDAGCALGAAYCIYHLKQGKKRCFELKHAYWGPGYSNEQIKAALEGAKLSYAELTDIPRQTAQLIADGNIVAWYQGRMEYGPRALGSRSILADPTREDMKDIINRWVKHREDFRPFAPTVLKERARDYFENITDSPFMLFVDNVKPGMRKKVPAITHIDGTARPQTIERSVSPLYYDVIAEFEKIAGVPVVLNTSFNVMGEPIIESPEQAIRCFYGTGLDCLVIGKYLLKKPGSKTDIQRG